MGRRFPGKAHERPAPGPAGRAARRAGLSGFRASGCGGPCGLITYRPAGHAWELFCIVADHPGEGVGTALVDGLVSAARRAGVRRVWLITTNDNLRALRFRFVGPEGDSEAVLFWDAAVAPSRDRSGDL